MTTSSSDARSCSRSRRSSASHASSWPAACEKIRITGGEPLVRRDLPVLVEKLAALGDVDLTLTTNGSLLARAGGRSRASRPDARDGEPRLARRRGLQSDERRRLPGRPRARGHRRGGGGRPPRQGQHGRQARPQRGLDPRAGAPLPRHRPHAPLHRVHGRRAHQRLAAGRRRARRPRSSRRSTPSCRSSRSIRPTAARSRSATATTTAAARSASSRRSRSRSAATARARDCRRTATLYTCLFAVRGHDLRASSVPARPTRRSPARSPASGRSVKTAIPSSAPPKPPTCPRSRCPSSEADAHQRRRAR